MSEASSTWWLMRVYLFEDYDKSILSASMEVLSVSHPAVVAKAVLWIALCLQQLPAKFDVPSLGLSCPPLVLVEECITRVSKFVCADDAIVSCIEGLECLILQGLIYGNDGKLLSAWLSHRRAADIARILGFHRAEPAPTESDQFQRRATFIWRHLLVADRHFSLMLGMHGSISNTAIDLYQSNPSDSKAVPAHNTSVLNPLARIAGTIIERNQTFTELTPAMLQLTQNIDAQIQLIEPPPLALADDIPPGKCAERSHCFLQLQYRLWYYQLMTWIHLPLLSERRTDNCFDYNRKTCLHACRSLIACYVNIRRLTENSFDSKTLDFQACTAALIIIINGLRPFGPQDLTKEDYFALDRVVAILDQLSSNAPPDKIVTRGSQVLKILRAIATGSDLPPLDVSEGPECEGRPNCVKLDIPYFGTIYLERRAFADQSLRSISDAPTPPPSLFNTVPGAYYPSFSWVGTTPDTTFPSNQTPETTVGGDNGFWFDPTTEFWALNSEFTFQAPFLADSSVNWDSWDMGF